MSPDIARIIDANLNRAREALRVMEDYARFVLDDAGSCEALKRARHALAEAVRQMPADTLLEARDTEGDVGTAISTPSEQRRADARDVFIAAAKRLPEALRTVEEYAKTFYPQVATAVEAVRYRAYHLEQRLLLRGQRSARFAKVRLYVIITAELCRQDWLNTAELAIAGGAGCIQLREKSLGDAELLERARRLVALCRERGALCIINDRPDIAVLSDADGVHVGQTDLSPKDARRIVGAGRLVGVSTHSPEQLRAALDPPQPPLGKGGRMQVAMGGSLQVAAGPQVAAQALPLNEGGIGGGLPDYIAVGPMFNSTTKPQANTPGPRLLATAVKATDIPIVAIGGITIDNANILLGTGAKCLCVCSSVIAATDPQAAAERLVKMCD